MCTGSRAELQMESVYLDNRQLDTGMYLCHIHRCDLEKEMLHLILEEGELTDISLDAVYQVRIFSDDNMMVKGIVMERFVSEDGKNLKIHIQKGIYRFDV